MTILRILFELYLTGDGRPVLLSCLHSLYPKDQYIMIWSRRPIIFLKDGCQSTKSSPGRGNLNIFDNWKLQDYRLLLSKKTQRNFQRKKMHFDRRSPFFERLLQMQKEHNFKAQPTKSCFEKRLHLLFLHIGRVDDCSSYNILRQTSHVTRHLSRRVS